MGLRNCPGCGKLMVETPRGICPECYANEEQAELKVVEFLRNVPKSSLEEIHEATGVATKTIMRMIKEKRIHSDIQVFYPCEACQTPIYEGRVCSKCSTALLKQAGFIQQNKEHHRTVAQEPKMNYIKDNRRN